MSFARLSIIQKCAFEKKEFYCRGEIVNTVHGNINVTKFHRATDYSISHSNYFTDERAKTLIDLFVEKKNDLH